MRHAKAESLIETLVAITVIVIATTSALSVMRTALRGNELIGNKVVAINLAEEAFEALKNLRDTNYLLFSSDPDECWDKINPTDVLTCSSTTALTDGYTYYLTQNFSSDPLYEWGITRATSASQGGITLYDVDLDGDGTTDKQMYAQANITSVTGVSSSSTNRNIYRRRISIEVLSDDSYDATVTITWTEFDQTKTLTLTRTISNVY
jgi:type II secretory pathway pseudopilin PulG